MRVVVDTNLLMSALMVPSSPPAKILALWRSRRFDLLTSPLQLDEIARVTRYPRIRSRLTPALAGRLINRLRDVAIIVYKLPKIDRSPDPDDDHLFALAEASRADFLITGDKALLNLKRHKSTRIVTAAVFVDLLGD